jgi:hypothetical protein
MGRPAGGPFSADQVAAQGPLGANDVQEALDLIAAAGPFYTTELQSGLVIAGSPAWTVIKLFPIGLGSTRHLRAEIEVAGGVAALPTSATVRVAATAARTAGGVTRVGSGVFSVDQTSGISLSGSWVVSGVDAALRLRASSGATVNLTLRYSWTEKLPP